MVNNIKVLIVDDEERFRKTTALILKKHGFETVAVANGLEAVEAIEASDFDVVVLDVKMPKMDGNEALREIKKIKPEVQVIMLTGHGTPESAFEGLRDGVFDYLTKPCAIDVLARKIREAHEKKGGLKEKEPTVKDIMVPVSSFSSIHSNKAVAAAIEEIFNKSFSQIRTTGIVQETVHRSILVLDENEKIIGIITFTDLLQGLQPPYMRLLTKKPNMADSIFLQSLNYSGMFTIMTKDLANKKVREIMSDAPSVIDANANLMEAASRLLNLEVRRLLVKEGEKVVGVIREQDLFFQMVKIIKNN